MYLTNFDAEYGSIVIPDVYSDVLSKDVSFEIVTNVFAQKLSLKRQDNIIGCKRMIYVIDRQDRTRDQIRKLSTDFFEKHLGFSDDDILLIDRNEFEQIKEVWQPKFSKETKEAMFRFARQIFDDRQHGLANQILSIAICEC